MFKRMVLAAILTGLLASYSVAQTTNGIMTGTVTDKSGAVIPAAEIDIMNQGTLQRRTVTTNEMGSYIVPQLPPGIYDITVVKQGFAKTERKDVQLVVNQSATLDFVLQVATSSQMIEVTGAPPELNATNATLGAVIEHEETVDLPLNGREFTQLTLLSPGAAPVQRAQQGSFTVALGVGGISPSVNGQNGQENNFTMDGVLNNALFTNIWMISPPPDAMQEFNVQSHITDAQYGISSGANINVATRAGTNAYHGAAWEFARNGALDAENFFDSTHLPYSQNQYGGFFSGPVPLRALKKNTWFSGYWEGFRSSKFITYFASTLSPAMQTGDFSALLGAQVGVDSLGRPEYANEIYDPTTSRPDPINPAAVLRDPFPGNKIPTNEINIASAAIMKKYYSVAPNLNVGPGVTPNLSFSGGTIIASDSTGIRIDHQMSNNDSLFGRYNRSNINQDSPEGLPGYVHTITNYAQTAVAGYTHLFGSATLLNLRYAWSDMNLLTNDEGAGAAFNASINFSLTGAGNPWGPSISFTGNGYTGVSQTELPLGPQKTNEIHADLSKVIGNHTLGVGGMYYRINSFDAVQSQTSSFDQSATSQGATPGPTGFAPASFLLGLPVGLSGYTGPGLNQTLNDNWWAGYIQDQWKASSRLTLTAGLRYDFIGVPSFSSVVSGLDFATGQFMITKPYLPLFPTAVGSSGFYYPQYNGLEPRFGIAYKASARTVVRTAFAIIDDHNHGLVQEDGNLRLSWPLAVTLAVAAQNHGLPNLYLNNLPAEASFINPNQVYVGSSSDPHNKIPYAMEYNLGIEQELSNTTVFKLDYVGSLDRHQALNPKANGAKVLGPGSLVSRGQPYPQYGGGVFGYEENAGNASYNALQAELRRSFSSGLAFTASYTFSKSLDLQSDPYGGTGIQNFYNLKAEKGSSDYDLPQMFVFSAVYGLPVGRNKQFLTTPNRLAQGLLGDWNLAGITSYHSGLPFSCATGDVANVGGGSQRCDKIANPYSGAGFTQTFNSWVNKASFTTIPYTFGTESRNDLRAPSFADVDFSVFKDLPLNERTKLQFRAEFFNILNHPNYLKPQTTITSSSFGKITTSNPPRDIQFAAKVVF